MLLLHLLFVACLVGLSTICQGCFGALLFVIVVASLSSPAVFVVVAVVCFSCFFLCDVVVSSICFVLLLVSVCFVFCLLFVMFCSLCIYLSGKYPDVLCFHFAMQCLHGALSV